MDIVEVKNVATLSLPSEIDGNSDAPFLSSCDELMGMTTAAP